MRQSEKGNKKKTNKTKLYINALNILMLIHQNTVFYCTHTLLFSAVKVMEFRNNGLYKEFLCSTQRDTM